MKRKFLVSVWVAAFGTLLLAGAAWAQAFAPELIIELSDPAAAAARQDSSAFPSGLAKLSLTNA